MKLKKKLYNVRNNFYNENIPKKKLRMSLDLKSNECFKGVVSRENATNLSSLPYEIEVHIFSFLERKDIISVSSLDKYHRKFIRAIHLVAYS